MTLNTFVNMGSKMVWVVLFLMEPVLIFAADQPAPSGAPPNFAPPAGPPPPPPLPIDDYILPMFFIGMLFAFFYFAKEKRTQRS